jgi:hypothetical protein
VTAHFIEDFYPTPKHLIERMLEGIKFAEVGEVIDLGAGRGDIAYTRPLHSGTPETLSKLLVSRFPFEQYSSDELRSPKEFIEDADGTRPRIALLSLWPKLTAKSLESSADGLHPFFTNLVNYDERSLSAYLTLLAQGQIPV